MLYTSQGLRNNLYPIHVKHPAFNCTGRDFYTYLCMYRSIYMYTFLVPVISMVQLQSRFYIARFTVQDTAQRLSALSMSRPPNSAFAPFRPTVKPGSFRARPNAAIGTPVGATPWPVSGHRHNQSDWHLISGNTMENKLALIVVSLLDFHFMDPNT